MNAFVFREFAVLLDRRRLSIQIRVIQYRGRRRACATATTMMLASAATM